MKFIMKKTLALLALLLSVFSLYAQDPNILWQRTIGGSGKEYLKSIEETSDGGMIIGGYSNSNISGDKSENSRGANDYWILKLDSSGNIVWQRTLGGDGEDKLAAFHQTSDGGYIVGGYSDSGISGEKTESSRGFTDYWILKLNSSGSIEWQKTIGGNEGDLLVEIHQTPDDKYILAGSSFSDISGDRTESRIANQDAWILGLDSNGNILWQDAYGISNNGFRLYDFQLTSDSGYILGGTWGIDLAYYLKKVGLDNVWTTFAGNGAVNYLSMVRQTSDGGFIVNGTTDNQSQFNYYVWKLDSAGNTLWDRNIDGALFEMGTTVLGSTEGGSLVGGYSDSYISGDKTENSQGLEDFWIVKLNNVGVIEWQNTIGGSDMDKLTCTNQNSDGTYIFGGNSSSNISGDKTEISRGSNDFWVIKHAAILGLEENPFATAITLYPSPAKNTLQLNTQDKTIDQINIYTMAGSKVLQLDVDTVSPTVDVSSLASGVYYLQLYSGKNVALKKFVKE